MPVIDLRGLVPSAPPENPGFNRTRKLAQGSPYEQALAFEQQAADVRSGRGMAALQAMQNQQDQIAQQAQNIRLQQEAQIAAEQATRGLSGLDPMQPDYLGKRQQILQQSPSALLDPQFRNALQVYDSGYNNIAKQQFSQQKATVQQQNQAKALALRGVSEFGLDPNDLADDVNSGNTFGIAQKISGARASGRTSAGTKSAKDPLHDTYKELYDISQKEIEDIGGLGGELTPEDKARLDEAALHKKNYFNYLKGLTPEGKKAAEDAAKAAQPVMDGEQAAAVAPSSAPIVVEQAVKKPLTPQEISKSIQESDDMGLARIGGDINYPLEARSKALEKLKASVTPMKNLSLREQSEFDKNKKDLIGKVEETIRKDNFVIDTLNPAWTEEKSKLAPLVEEFAKKNNLNIDNLYNSIHKLEKIKVSPDDAKRIRNAQQDIDGKWYANVEDAILGNSAETSNQRLVRLNGEHKGGSGLGAIAAAYANHLLGTNKVTNAGVLRALAQERLNTGGALMPTAKSPTGAIPDAKQASLLDSVYNKFFK